MPLALLWVFLTYWYLKKHSHKIISYFEEKKVVTLKNGMLILISFLLPLIFIILMSKR